MRYMPVLFLCACGSEIGLMPERETITNTVYVTAPETEATPPAPDNSETPATTPPETEMLCGWWVPENGAFGDDVYVESMPTFYLVGGTTETPITHWQGEDAEFEFLVDASPCGDIELLDVLIVVQDVDGNGWLHDVNDRGTPGVLENVYWNEVFDPVYADNMAVTPTGDELHYEWCSDEFEDASCSGDFIQSITADTRRMYEFEFTATDLVPESEDYEIYVAYVIWRDVATGQVIVDYDVYGALHRPVHCLP